MQHRRRESQFYVGELVRPSFGNESVYLFPCDPTQTLAVGEIINKFGPPWPRNSTGIVLDFRDGGWVRLVVPGGGLGWIGDWNIVRVE